MEQATKTVSNLKYDLILGDRASGVYNASEIFRGAGCWGISQKSAVTVSRFAICIISRGKNEPGV
jgi:hypothetical protein